ncbi:MAG TPA: membrane protein FxsA [Pasteurellaceae bacterium]|nr:membrane protein FxsA [Pasteurellaceae bacterium]
MPIIFFFLILFLFVYLELSLLVWLAGLIGVFGLILLLITASVVGLFIIRLRGWYLITNIRKQLAQGLIPTQSLFKSGIWLVAGVLFFIPGLLTDILAVAILLPPIGLLLETFIKSKVTFFRSQNWQETDRSFHYHRNENGEVFEAEYEKQTDEDKRLK